MFSEMKRAEVSAISPFLADRLFDCVCSEKERSHIQHFVFWIQEGLDDSPEVQAEEYKNAAAKHHFDLVPNNGWVSLAFELYNQRRWAPVGLPKRDKIPQKLSERGFSIVKNLDGLILELERYCNTALLYTPYLEDISGDLSHPPEIRVANTHDYETLKEIRKRVLAVAHWNSKFNKPKKWAATMIRRARIYLAVGISDVFQREFNFEPKPRGGSIAMPDDEENEWCRFYQTIAEVALSEIVTPDRQAVLWEAYRHWQLGTPHSELV